MPEKETPKETVRYAGVDNYPARPYEQARDKRLDAPVAQPVQKPVDEADEADED